MSVISSYSQQSLTKMLERASVMARNLPSSHPFEQNFKWKQLTDHRAHFHESTRATFLAQYCCVENFCRLITKFALRFLAQFTSGNYVLPDFQ